MISLVTEDGDLWRWRVVTPQGSAGGLESSEEDAQEAAIRAVVDLDPSPPIRDDQGTPGARRVARSRRRA